MANEYKIAAIPGDGIGKEVIAAGVAGTGSAGQARWRHSSCRWSISPGAATTTRARAHDAGRRPRHAKASTRSTSARSARRTCPTTSPCGDCASRSARASTSTPTCARPACCPASSRRSKLSKPGDIDWVIVRENSEGEYAGHGGRAHRGHPEEVGTETAIFTRAGVTRIMRFAFELARRRPRKLLT